MRNNDKTKARAEEREKNIEWIKRLFTAWRVSHAERKEAGEDDPEEDETKVEIPPSAVTIYGLEKFLRDLGSGQVFTPRQCGLGRAGQCGFHTRGR